jgi:hypothetical protein
VLPSELQVRLSYKVKPHLKEERKREREIPGTGVTRVVSYYVGAGNQTQIFWVFLTAEPSLQPPLKHL